MTRTGEDQDPAAFLSVAGLAVHRETRIVPSSDDLAQDTFDRDADAWEELVDALMPRLWGLLLHKGASPVETEELVQSPGCCVNLFAVKTILVRCYATCFYPTQTSLHFALRARQLENLPVA